MHDRLATKVNKYMQKTEIPEWITKGKTTLIQKDPLKPTAPNNNVLTDDVENTNGTN